MPVTIHDFVQSLMTGRFLLIIGSGEEDPRISYWLRHFIETHLSGRRVIEVTMSDDPPATGKLARYKLVREEIRPKVTHAAERASLVASGLTTDSCPPAQLMFAKLGGSLTKPAALPF